MFAANRDANVISKGRYDMKNATVDIGPGADFQDAGGEFYSYSMYNDTNELSLEVFVDEGWASAPYTFFKGEALNTKGYVSKIYKPNPDPPVAVPSGTIWRPNSRYKLRSGI
jgi:hypothetical protein